jgi:hypothetical protein
MAVELRRLWVAAMVPVASVRNDDVRVAEVDSYRLKDRDLASIAALA